MSMEGLNISKKLPDIVELDVNGELLTDNDGKKYRYSLDGVKYGGDFPEEVKNHPENQSTDHAGFDLPPPLPEDNLVI